MILKEPQNTFTKIALKDLIILYFIIIIINIALAKYIIK